jgi:hypothetical protein
METYQKPSIEIVALDNTDTVLTSVWCGGKPVIELPDLP